MCTCYLWHPFPDLFCTPAALLDLFCSVNLVKLVKLEDDFQNAAEQTAR